jgi:hypothetical protein
VKKHVPHHVYTAAMIRLMVDIPNEAVFIRSFDVVEKALATHNALLSELKACHQALKEATDK